ncbi:rna-directed dna polymerase from mobile element jockey-like [Limosa lapponica baueri]|uniref:Rna-directed dna polymerase from mobile element jockey-like n=1 Tax=Limosa lapponica baueri TaxID=1758121 RepID=A0A2I0TW29_LIMLA|nr:rna-directed dna polymerase from mobile element jockey-like [Limosa lapponica baueri]
MEPGSSMPVLVGKSTSKVLQSVISVEAGNGDPCGTKDMRSNDSLATTEGPEHSQVGIRACPPKKVAGQLAQLECIYTNARSMGNKQEELEATIEQENYDTVAITETWWEDSHNWSAAIDGYQLFRRDRHGRRGVRIKGKASKAATIVAVCYRPPNQDVEVDEIFYKQLAEVSLSLTLVLVGDFNFLDVCWKYNKAEREQSRRFLECVEDNFLTQLVKKQTRESALLDLLLVNRGLVGDVKVGVHLGHSDHEMIEFSIL